MIGLWKKAGGAPAEFAPPAGVVVFPSRLLGDILASCRRRAGAGEARGILVAGPSSGATIETFHTAGCRVTVTGDEAPCAKVDAPDASFDVVLGFDVLDHLSDREARTCAAEWARLMRPGGGLYLLARQDRTQHPNPWRVDALPDGGLRLHPLPRSGRPLFPRQNREIEDIVRPLLVRDIHLRRDGFREVLCRKR